MPLVIFPRRCGSTPTMQRRAIILNVPYNKWAHPGHFTNKKIKEANIKFRAIDYISGSSKPGSSKQGLEDVISLTRKGLGNIVLDTRVTKQEDWPVFALHLAENGFKYGEESVMVR